MYEVKIINDGIETIINAVSISYEAPRITGQCKFGINKIDSFSFNILPNNPGFNKIMPKTTLIEVTNCNEIIFKGRVLLPVPKMDSNGLLSISVTCESELGYLHDTKQRYGEYHNITVKDFFELIINNHNKGVEDYKKFTVGNVTVTDNNDSLYRYLGYDSTFDTIKDKLIDRLGGELIIRYEDGIRYLDYLKESGTKRDTEIILSKNLVSIEQERDPLNIITRLVVLGPKLQDTEERMTIAEINNGLDYIDDIEAIKLFGINEDTVIFDDVNVVENLLAKGEEYLKENNRIKKKHKIDALDLSIIGLNIDSFNVGDTYRVINPIMDIDEDLRVIEKTVDINSPQTSSLSIGDKFEDIKDYQIDNINTAKEVKSVKSTVQTTIATLSSVSVELNNTVEVLNSTNENVGNLSEVVQANVNATNAIANTISIINSKLDKLSKRIAMEV